jgi:hypothetical protein
VLALTTTSVPMMATATTHKPMTMCRVRMITPSGYTLESGVLDVCE